MANRDKLQPRDLVFVNAMAAAVLTWSYDADWLEVMLAEAKAALPHVNRDHVHLGPIAEAADIMLIRAAIPAQLEERQKLYRMGHMEARSALVRYFRWRAGEALAAVQAREVPA